MPTPRTPMPTEIARLAALAAAVTLAFMPAKAAAQEAAARAVRLEATPSSLELTVGETAALTVLARDADGNPVDAPIRIVGRRNAVDVDDGEVTGLAAGEHEVIATLILPPDANAEPLTLRIPVTVRYPAVARIELTPEPGVLYVGTTLAHDAAAVHEDGTQRPEALVQWTSSDADIATVDPFGNVTAHAPGRVQIAASFENATGSVEYDVAPLSAARLEITGGADRARTGDVLDFNAVLYDEEGNPVPDVPVTWSHGYTPLAFEQHGASARGQLDDGRFVADVAGIHTVVATAGPVSARKTFRIDEREAVQKLQVLGVGSSTRVRTTDLWPFEGPDGRDYALTGAKLSDGFAFVWDITDPANVVKTDSVQVDARTINDVKVAPGARYGVLSREGASNRRNGVIILDLSTPAHPTVASILEEELTGGVHNVFATEDYLYALSGGDKYVIIDMRDIREPRIVGEYNHPDSRIHDVWVHDGIAYSAEWGTGVVVVDVGNGGWGGSPENPVFVTSFKTPTGGTHAVFPYQQPSTGKLYLFVGDEIMTRTGLAMEGPPGSWSSRYNSGSYANRYDPATGEGGVPLATQGYIQVFDFTDYPEAPEMVARYEVTEYGTHNIWVEDDKLYQAYYEGGLRVVDVSGELMGNLYTQGREIAAFKPFDPEGFVANSPMVWSAIPYKGNIWLADTNSGLWAVKLQAGERPVM
jgi:hypothetical protein